MLHFPGEDAVAQLCVQLFMHASLVSAKLGAVVIKKLIVRIASNSFSICPLPVSCNFLIIADLRLRASGGCDSSAFPSLLRYVFTSHFSRQGGCAEGRQQPYRGRGIGPTGSAAILLCNVAYGSLADKPSRAKIRICPLWSESGQARAQLDCPLSANSRHRTLGLI
jgi:hypothetical protein